MGHGLPVDGGPVSATTAGSVLQVAWQAAGATQPDGDGQQGECARCGREAALMAVRAVISDQFTGFDSWLSPGRGGLCPACVWGYTTPSLRLNAQLVNRATGTYTVVDRGEVGDYLSEGGLSADVALVVPLRPGRKHVLPEAVWGRVCTENAQVGWTTRDCARLEQVRWLRGCGFGPRMLTEAAPAWSVLRRVDQKLWAQVLRAWDELAVWRIEDSPWLAVALWSSRPQVER